MPTDSWSRTGTGEHRCSVEATPGPTPQGSPHLLHVTQGSGFWRLNAGVIGHEPKEGVLGSHD